ncbi:MAG: hypothetical protein V2I33_24860, partial [Kangiellaceae bacterium]|nr:hypothetical protein [Kangiellaceae bacterium]
SWALMSGMAFHTSFITAQQVSWKRWIINRRSCSIAWRTVKVSVDGFGRWLLISFANERIDPATSFNADL